MTQKIIVGEIHDNGQINFLDKFLESNLPRDILPSCYRITFIKQKIDEIVEASESTTSIVPTDVFYSCVIKRRLAVVGISTKTGTEVSIKSTVGGRGPHFTICFHITKLRPTTIDADMTVNDINCYVTSNWFF